MVEANELAAKIAQAVEGRLGRADPEVSRIVAEELAGVLESAGPPLPIVESGPAPGRSRIVVTSHGRNRSGIVARLSAAIDEFSGDIRDLSQTIVGDYFTMLFVIDLSDAPSEGATFSRLRQRLKTVGEELGVHVVVMHDDILSSMHSI